MVQSEVPNEAMRAYRIARLNGEAALLAATARRRSRSAGVQDNAKPIGPRAIGRRAQVILNEFDKLYRLHGGTYYGMLRDVERLTGVNHSTILHVVRAHRVARCEPSPNTDAESIVKLWDSGLRTSRAVADAFTAQSGKPVTTAYIGKVIATFRAEEWRNRKQGREVFSLAVLNRTDKAEAAK